MKGRDAQDQHAADLIFAGALDQPVLAGDPLNIGMRRVRVTDRNDIAGLLAQGVTGVRREWIGYNDGLTAPDPETGKSQPCNIHVISLA